MIQRKKILNVLEPIVSILLSFLVGTIVIYLIGEKPLNAYITLFKGAFGSALNISNTIAKVTTLTFCGLSYAFAYRCGLINIGAEGQMYIGALFGSLAVLFMPGPAPLVVIVAIIAGIAGGALTGALVGFLKVKFGANEVITTVMMNYIAQDLILWAVSGPIQDPSSDSAQTIIFDKKYWLPSIPGTNFNIGIILLIACLVFFYVFMQRSKQGFALRIVGANKQAASYAGINVRNNYLAAMSIAGAMGGLGGVSELLGIQHRLLKGMASNYGFDGIAVALLGGNNPIGMLFSGTLLGAMKNGGNAMQMFTKVPSSVVDLIRAMVIIFVLLNVLGKTVGFMKERKEKNIA